MRNKVFRILISILLLITLTSANFILLGVTSVTYAVEQLSLESETNHKNISFMAYFKEGESQVTEHSAKVNVEQEMLYLQVAVKQEGYFNGSISLANSNFKLKTDTKHDKIQSITEDTIQLNQITAGETIEIPVGITILKDTNFDVSLLTAESKIKLQGTYTYGTRPDTKKITGERTVELKLTSPYEKGKEGIFLNQTVLTNKVFQYKNTPSRIIQLQIETGMEGNLYPIKTEKLELQAPMINKVYPTAVLVETPDTLAMNNKKIQESDYTYNKETGLINITSENETKEGKVVWNQTGTDKYIITYIFAGTEEIEQQKLSAKAEIALYDPNNTVARYSRTTTLSTKEMDSSITVTLNNTENDIYKGSIYEGIEKEITQNINVNVNLIGNMDIIKVQEDLSNTNMLGIKTKAVTVNLDNLIDILGTEGQVTIRNKETNTIIGTVTGTTKAEENKNITVQLPEGTGEILVEITKPVKAGILTISSSKVIPEQDRQAMQSVSNMVFKAMASYKLGEAESQPVEATSTVSLKETQTYATLELSKTEFSTMRTNQNVEMRIVLHSNNEKYELYKNPHIRLTLPTEFEGINFTSMNLVNEEEMTLTQPTLNGNVLEFSLQGEQTRYKDIAIEGATILITADLTANKKQKNVNTQFVLEYENEKAMHYPEGASKGTTIVNTKIVSYAGLITTNSISEYGIETINNEGNNTGKLQLVTEAKTATVSAQVINNYETSIANVAILGTFPTEKAMDENNIKTAVINLQTNGIDNSRIKIYYSENSQATADTNNVTNAWIDNILNSTSVKKYLIVIDKLEPSEEIDFMYSMNIPEGLEYNKFASEEYVVTFKGEALSEQTVKAQKLTLETGIGPEVTTTLDAYIGNEKGSTAKEGEKIEYAITAKNTGSVSVENVQLKGIVPEGTIYVEEAPYPDQMGVEVDPKKFMTEDANKKEVIFDGIKLEPGEEITKTYIVKVQETSEGKTITNTIETIYGGLNKKSDDIKINVAKGEIEATTVKGIGSTGDITPGKIVNYIVLVKNISNKDLKNIKLSVALENATLFNISYLKDEAMEIVTDTNTVTIPQIKKDQLLEVYLAVKINEFNDTETKQVVVQPVITVDRDDYKANRQTALVDPIIVEMTNSSENTNQYVEAGENITYKIEVSNVGKTNISKMRIRDEISKEEEIKTIMENGVELKEGQYSEEKSLETNGKYIEIEETINSGEKKTFLITTQVNPALDNGKTIEISNVASIYAEALELATATVTHLVEPSSTKVGEDIDLNTPNNSQDPNAPTEPSNPEASKPQNPSTSDGKEPTENGQDSTEETQAITKLISGYAWLDKNENGRRDDDETLLDGITVKLFNTQTNEFQKNSKGDIIKTTTSKSGMYTLENVPQGSYMVVFEHDNSKYALTTYEKQGVTSDRNSKVISKEMTIDGVQKTVAVSEVIEVKDQHISYINIGLKERKVYDMKLEKMITRVIVQNSNGTETTQFQDSTLAKVDIHAKQLNGSNVVVEYKIRVTNEGETEGYIKKIADYVSGDFKFSSELNKDWYQSGSSIYNSSLANTKLAPGESKEVTLTLTKQMTENNTGTITNTAEIVQSYNEQGLKDMDSTEGNQARGEDDMGQADLIVSIKTGEVIATVSVIITIIAILALGTFIIIKKIMKPIVI